MRKIISVISSLMLAISMLVLPSSAGAVDPPNWDVTGTYVWDVFGTYFHDITITTQDPDGNFSGVGGWPAGDPLLYQTTEDITGQVTGDNITFTTHYNGPYGIGSEFTMTGTIEAGHISGISPWVWHFDGQAKDVDPDGDNVSVWNDLCPGTLFDATSTGGDENFSNSTVNPLYEKWGQNRWLWTEKGWVQKFSNSKGTTYKLGGQYTYGCSAVQILNWLNKDLGNVMNGHWKFGLSSSVLEDFQKDLSDGVLDGKYLIDTVTLNSNAIGGANSISLPSGVNYVFEVSGTWQNRGWERVDAKYTTGDNWATYTDAPSGGFPAQLLDLQVNNNFSVDWGEYSLLNTYTADFVGIDAPVNFRVFDGDVGSNIAYPGWYGDNIGLMTVKIYAQI